MTPRPLTLERHNSTRKVIESTSLVHGGRYSFHTRFIQQVMALEIVNKVERICRLQTCARGVKENLHFFLNPESHPDISHVIAFTFGQARTT